jgi:hypothetical protein
MRAVLGGQARLGHVAREVGELLEDIEIADANHANRHR